MSQSLTKNSHSDADRQPRKASDYQTLMRVTADYLDFVEQKLSMAADLLIADRNPSAVVVIMTTMRRAADALKFISSASKDIERVDQAHDTEREDAIIARFTEHLEHSFSGGEATEAGALISRTQAEEESFRQLVPDYDDALDYLDGFFRALLHAPCGGQPHLVNRGVQILTGDFVKIANQNGQNPPQVAYETAIRLGYTRGHRDSGLH